MMGLQLEELFGRVRELLIYDASSPLIFNSGLFLFLFTENFYKIVEYYKCFLLQVKQLFSFHSRI